MRYRVGQADLGSIAQAAILAVDVRRTLTYVRAAIAQPSDARIVNRAWVIVLALRAISCSGLGATTRTGITDPDGA